MILRLRTFTAIISIFAAASGSAPATGFGHQAPQTKTGKLEGVIYNVQSGDPLVKACVEIIGLNRTVESGVDGTYLISLDPGTYTLRFFREGFTEQSITNVVIVAGQGKELNASPPEKYGDTPGAKARPSTPGACAFTSTACGLGSRLSGFRSRAW